MKNTWQKQQILQTVTSMTNHPTADEVYQELNNQGVNIGIATVYRNLNSFAQKGLISKIIIPNAPDRFDFRTDNHQHFMCEECGKVFDADVDVTIKPKNNDFKYNGYTLVLYGICDECKKSHATN